MDCRSAFPPSKEVPCAFGLLGVLCCGQKGEQLKGEASRIDLKDLCPLVSCGCDHVNLYCKFPHCCGTDCNSECLGCASGCSNKCVNCQYCLFGCPLCKCVSTVGCMDNRCSVPCDDDVPCAIALCGVFCAGKKMEGNEAVPMLSAATEDSDGAPQVEQMARDVQQPEPPAVVPAKVMLITIALKGACLLSAILGLAAPLTSATGDDYSSYLYKKCEHGSCTSYGSTESYTTSYGGYSNCRQIYVGYNGYSYICTRTTPWPKHIKAALVFCCLALILSLAQAVLQAMLHFTKKPPNHKLLGYLSIPNAFFFLLSFALVTAETAKDMNYSGEGYAYRDHYGVKNVYHAGYAFLIIGFLASVAHIAACLHFAKQAAGTSEVEMQQVSRGPPKFDPMTGAPIIDDAATESEYKRGPPKFDPMTGAPIINDEVATGAQQVVRGAAKFDPTTGAPILDDVKIDVQQTL